MDHFLLLLNPLFIRPGFTPPVIVLLNSLVFVSPKFLLLKSFVFVSPSPLPSYLVLAYKNPFESLVKPAVVCKGLIFLELYMLSLLMFSFLFELGRWLMSGKND